MGTLKETEDGKTVLTDLELPGKTDHAIVMALSGVEFLGAYRVVRENGPPPPPPEWPLDGTTAVIVGGRTIPVDGINVARGAEQTVLYDRRQGEVADVNEWGTDVVVDGPDGVIADVHDREGPPRVVSKTFIPEGGYVISAHGQAGRRLWGLAKTGGVVIRVKGDSPPPPPPPPPPPSRSLIGVYARRWPNDSERLSWLPVGANLLYYAFARNPGGGRPKLVGYGAQGRESTLDELADLRNRGVKVALSLGGEGGTIDLSDPVGFAAGLRGIHADLEGYHYLDIDVEAGALSVDAVLRIDDALGDLIQGWTAAPPGHWVERYLPVCAALAKRDRLALYGQQFYDTPAGVTWNDVANRLEQALAEQIPAPALALGMRVGPSPRMWTRDQCQAMLSLARDKYGVRHCYFWDLANSETRAAVADAAQVLA